MHLFLIGVNHTTAPVEVRESLAFAREEIPALSRALVSECGLTEAVVLATCNRTEVVAAGSRGSRTRVLAFLLEQARRRQRRSAGDGARLLERHFYTYHEEEAAAHLFRVAAGLDSLVIGEPQVLGQVKEALAVATRAGTAGAIVGRLFQLALRVGKRVRTETGISEGAASISYAAVKLASRVFGDLDGKQVLLIGAGKMSELAARTLAEYGTTRVVVANRTFERAQQLAGAFRGQAIPFDGVAHWLRDVDIVISSTGAPEYVIGYDTVKRILPLRRGRPLFMIDIAVPRDVDPRVHELEGVFLYNLDDLQQVVDANMDQRLAYVADAEAIVAEEAQGFSVWLKERRVAPVIAEMRREAEEIRRCELERVLRRLNHLSEEDKEHIRALTITLTNKLLHGPTMRLKEAARGDDDESPLFLRRDASLVPQAELRRERERGQGKAEIRSGRPGLHALAPEGGCSP